MNQNQAGQDIVALRRMEAEIATGRIRVYRNLLDQPYICFDIDKQPLADTHLHLRHKNVRGLLTQFIWKVEGILLHERDLDRILQALSGQSLSEKRDQVTDPALLELLDTEPTVAVIVEFMHARKQSKLEDTMESLWKTLRDFARERGMLVRGKNRFPGGANVLCRKMNRFEKDLKLFSIRFSTTHSNGCKVVIERLDDPTYQPSAESSAPNPLSSNDLPPKDDKLALLEMLAAKHRNLTIHHHQL